MQYLYNITFPSVPSRLDHLLGWLRTYAIPALTAPGSGAGSPLLSMIDGPAAEQSQLDSVCLQLAFGSDADVERWEAETLAKVVDRYQADFAPEPLFFSTLLRILPLA